MKKRGPKPSSETANRRAFVLESVRAGIPTREIAASIERSDAYVRNICCRAGQPIRRQQRLDDTQRQRLTDLIRRGMPITHVAEATSLSAHTVRKFATENRLVVVRLRRASPWNDRADNLLRKHYGPRGNAVKLARILNTTKNAVVGRAHRLGIAKGYADADGPPA